MDNPNSRFDAIKLQQQQRSVDNDTFKSSVHNILSDLRNMKTMIVDLMTKLEKAPIGKSGSASQISSSDAPIALVDSNSVAPVERNSRPDHIPAPPISSIVSVATVGYNSDSILVAHSAALLSGISINATPFDRRQLTSLEVTGVLVADLPGVLGSRILVGYGVNLKIQLGPFCDPYVSGILSPTYCIMGGGVLAPMNGTLWLTGTPASPVCFRIPAPFDRGKYLVNIPPKMFVLDLDPKPPDPYILPAILLLYLGSIVPTNHVWVVHGQCRPPDDTPKEISAWNWSLFMDPSLEDKTVLKGGVLMGMIYEGGK